MDKANFYTAGMACRIIDDEKSGTKVPRKGTKNANGTKKRLRADARSRERRKPASDAGTNDKEWTAEPCPNKIWTQWTK